MHSINYLVYNKPALYYYIPLFIFIVIISTVFASEQLRILVFSETAGWDHNTREEADRMITSLGNQNGFDVETTSSSETWFTAENLAAFAAVCFVNTTGTIFTDDEAAAFKQYMQNGGGYVGIHAATDCEYERLWYGEMTGANFNGHPYNSATAKVAVLNKEHPSTAFITADTLTRTDEWYFWGNNPDFRDYPLIDPAENDSITVLMDLVVATIPGSTLSHFHPICWYKNYGEGRVWYCGFGHDPATFNDSLIVKMLLSGIQYAAGMTIVKTDPIKTAPRSITNLKYGQYQIAVYDISGRCVYSATVKNKNIPSINRLWKKVNYRGTRASAGHYLLTVTINGNTVIKSRVIEQ